MKKLMIAAVMLASAAVMVSCGGKSSSMISKGSKSEMDTLSYAIGMNIGQGIAGDIPEMKFDIDLMASSAEKALLEKEAAEAQQ